jgi:hypothetical protein
MFSRIREHFGTAGLIVAIVALVAALGGGAYAATGGSGGGKATASAKQGKQGKPGKPGKTGPAGPAGPAGPQGPAGPAGPKGDAGANGTNGTNGAPGAAGPAGPKGDPWTAGGVLPPEATETGAWSAEWGISGLGGEVYVPISFPIPLSDPLDKEHIRYVKENGKEWNPATEAEVTPVNCTGSSADPTAPPGFLCVYVGHFAGFATESGIGIFQDPGEHAFAAEVGGATTGTAMSLYATDAPEIAWGTWAVTAEEE